MLLISKTINVMYVNHKWIKYKTVLICKTNKHLYIEDVGETLNSLILQIKKDKEHRGRVSEIV